MVSLSPSDLKHTSCIFRCYASYASRDQATQQKSIDGTSDGKKYANNKHVLSARESVDNYLEQFPHTGMASKVGPA